MEFPNIIGNLLEALQRELPGEGAHTLMMPVNRPYSSALKENAQGYRKSAVAIVLYEEHAALKSVLIERPKYDGVHSRQIAFPGGKMDASDRDLEFTARRECKEEIAIPHDALQLLGTLSDIYIPVSQFIVAPHVFYIEKLPELIPDPREVERIIPFHLERITEDTSVQHTNMRFGNGLVQKDIPYFDIEGKIVWGATGMMLAELREILLRV